LIETEKGSAREIAKRLDEQVSAEERKSWEGGTPTDWANESLALTRDEVYPIPESHQVSQEYANRALAIINKRLAQASLRLAWLLNEALKCIEAISLINSIERNPAWPEQIR